MKAVWSFWTKPFNAQRRFVWPFYRHHLMAWVLSLETSKKHYRETALVTDEEGARLLVDGLGLEFTSVSTELEALRDADPDWWVLGKLWTYRLQDKPFVHIDNDVFFWRPLPEALELAPVFAQNPERFSLANQAWYRPVYYDEAIRSMDGWARGVAQVYGEPRGHGRVLRLFRGQRGRVSPALRGSCHSHDST